MKIEGAEGLSRPGGLNISPPAINVTPLVDVLLVLLIIFFVIQPQREAKFDSRIPQKPQVEDAVDQAPAPDLLMVGVISGTGPDQLVELNSKPMSLTELGVTLKDLLEQRAIKSVYIKASRERDYGDVVQVIDVLKGAGAGPIGLQVDFLL